MLVDLELEERTGSELLLDLQALAAFAYVAGGRRGFRDELMTPRMSSAAIAERMISAWAGEMG